MSLEISRVRSIEECDDCRFVAAQIWGEPAACSTPQMWVHTMYGGVTLVARENGKPIGFLLSFPALYKGQLVLWSHETGILPEYLHQGIGRQMKQMQREQAAELGYQNIAWTFDPLVARNAYFNIEKLRAEILEYKINVYGTDESDLVNQGIETDRWVAVWPVNDSEQVRAPREAYDVSGSGSHDGIALLIVQADGTPRMSEADVEQLDASSRFVTEIPQAFAGDATDLQLRTAWRTAFRQVALRLMKLGVRPSAFVRNNSNSYYIWSRRGEDGCAN